MKLQGSKGQALELSIMGYQFPSGPTEWHDRNWLNVRIQVVHSRGSWRSADPTLLTSEALELADWLDAVSKGDVTQDDLRFTEPNLRFEVSSNALRVYLELESRPSWAKADGAGAMICGLSSRSRKSILGLPRRTYADSLSSTQ